MGLDASSAEYVRILKKVGWTEFIAQRKEVVISKPITVLMTSVTPATLASAGSFTTGRR
jgi:UDP-3-O-acyl-N-acetylglucosamine deacetylase